jgi:CheY-like chemotaxis protein
MGRISLVLDDEPSVRKFISAFCNGRISRPSRLETVPTAFGSVQELGHEVALIVSDIHMPNGDGVAFAQAVRAGV